MSVDHLPPVDRPSPIERRARVRPVSQSEGDAPPRNREAPPQEQEPPSEEAETAGDDTPDERHSFDQRA